MKSFLKATKQRFSTAGELIKAFWMGPYWWLVPLVALLLIASVLIIAIQGAPFLAPFVYSVF